MTENTVSNRIAFVEKFLAAAGEKVGTKFVPATGSNEFRLATAQEFIRTIAQKYGVKVEEIDVAGAADTIEDFLAAKAKDANVPYTTFAQSLEAEAAAEAEQAAQAQAPADDGVVAKLKATVERLVAFAKGYGFKD